MNFLFSLICGVIFGLGLLISGMANPLKVQNFLDLFGTWDPSLAFVMGGAICVSAPGYWFIRKRNEPFFASTFEFPTRTDFDKKLIVGASIFGIGWGLGGFCPGPALTAASMSFLGASSNTLIFVGAMLVGVIAKKLLMPQGA
ncbi:MAG: DUF6691 family protein [Nitratireductor sp.]